MKLIVDLKPKHNFLYRFKNILRDTTIVLSYTLGFTLYAFIFLVWTINFKNINLGWISIPIIGFVLGVIHIIFIYRGSLICKTITMVSILLFTFVLPFVIAFIN